MGQALFQATRELRVVNHESPVTNSMADDDWREERLGRWFSYRAALNGRQAGRSCLSSLVPSREQTIFLRVNQASDETRKRAGGDCEFTGRPIPRAIGFLETPLQHFAHEIPAKLLRYGPLI